MRLEQITLTNFKGFEETTLKFTKGFNLIIGNNGTGKSSILEGISLGLASFLEKIPDSKNSGIKAKDVRCQLTPVGDATFSKQYFTPTSILSSFTIDSREFSVTRELKDESGTSRTSSQPKDFANYALSLANDPNSMLPLLNYQRATRKEHQTNSTTTSSQLKRAMTRNIGYSNCFDTTVSSKEVLNWAFAMDYAAYQRKQSIVEYETFKTIVTDFMIEMDELPCAPKLHYSATLSELVYETNTGCYTLSQLSAGYQSVLWMVMELAYRAVTLNPHIDLSISPITGVVLIDELDMHLHPKWQWKIIDALTKTFPAVQFIAATHSPIVISSCKNENIILIEGKQPVEYLPSGYGISVNDVLQLSLGSTDLPEIVTHLLDDFDTALDNFDQEAMEQSIHRLEEELGASHPKVAGVKAEMSLNTIIEEL
ncbi:MAG: AAA family ATPase [Eubacteriales bacterium]